MPSGNPMNVLIESLFRSYPYMPLHQRIIVLSSLAAALGGEKLIDRALDMIPKALEIESTLRSIEELYKRGEIGEIEIPDESKVVFEIEIRLLKTILASFVKSGSGVSKYF